MAVAGILHYFQEFEIIFILAALMGVWLIFKALFSKE
jgi:hypothetical protein